MIDNPMRLPSTGIELSTIKVVSQKPSQSNKFTDNTSTSSSIQNRCKLNTIYLITISLTALLYYFTESMVRAVQNNIYYSNNITMIDAAVPRTIFYVACLGSIANLIIKSSGIAVSTQPTNILRYKWSKICIATISILATISIISIPSIYLRPPPFQTHNVLRGNCSQPLDIHPEFYSTCPSFQPENTSFVKARFFPKAGVGDLSSLQHTQKAYSYAVRLIESAGLLATLDGRMKKHGFNYPFLVTEKTCTDHMLDAVCESAFARCKYNDCNVNGTKFSCGIIEYAKKWIDCGRSFCPDNDMLCKSDFTGERATLIVSFFKEAIFNDLVLYFSPDDVEWIKSFFDNLEEGVDKSFKNSDCVDWSTKNENTVIEPTNRNGNQTSCNPNQTVYKLQNEGYVKNNSIFLLVVGALFCFVVNYYSLVPKTGSKLYFNFTSIHICCFAIAMLMSMLVYIGALALEKAHVKNPDQHDALTQKVWSCIYFLTSFFCFSGGVVLLVQKNDGVDVPTPRQRRASTILPELAVIRYCTCERLLGVSYIVVVLLLCCCCCCCGYIVVYCCCILLLYIVERRKRKIFFFFCRNIFF